MRAKRFRYLIGILGLAIVYHLAARLGLQMAYVQQNTSPVWPPSGIALAALLLAGIEYWPGITLGVVAGSLLTGAPLGLALGFGVANTLEALIAALLLTGPFKFDVGIGRIRDVVGLIAAAACGTAVSAVIGVMTLVVYQGVPLAAFASLAMVWFIGNLLGCLVVTPLLLTCARLLSLKAYPPWNRPRLWEAAVFLAALVAVTLYIFLNPSGGEALHQALIYIMFPFAIWAALRMGQIGAAATVFVISGIAIAGTIRGLGPFARIPLNDSLILLQTFTGVVAVISLTLAASASERRHAAAALQKQMDENTELFEQVLPGQRPAARPLSPPHGSAGSGADPPLARASRRVEPGAGRAVGEPGTPGARRRLARAGPPARGRPEADRRPRC